MSTQKTTQAQKANTTTTTSIGQDKQPILYDLLANHSSKAGVSLSGAPAVKGTTSTTRAKRAGSSTKSFGSKIRTITSTSTNTSRPKPYTITTNSIPGISYKGDQNQDRGEKINVSTLSQYLHQHKLYTAEEFLDHATQGTPNRGTELFNKLAIRDWDKKIQQALDIARAYTPNTTYRDRLEAYTVPEGFNYERGDYCFNEYMELFNHHGIDKIKLQKFFATLFSDNGKRNTIYMYGKADAGKTTIIKLFDAFYASWEIGRCSAQAINSNFWLQDLYQKRLFHADEILATQVNIDTLKLLLEGNDDLTTDIKYAKRVTIRGRPVLMATNEPIWQHMACAADPIRRRCEWVKMVRPWHKKVMFMHTKDKETLKYVLHRLYNHCFPEGYETWKNDTAFIDMIGEIQDLTDIINNHDPDYLDNQLNVDDFVSEMN